MASLGASVAIAFALPVSGFAESSKEAREFDPRATADRCVACHVPPRDDHLGYVMEPPAPPIRPFLDDPPGALRKAMTAVPLWHKDALTLSDDDLRALLVLIALPVDVHRAGSTTPVVRDDATHPRTRHEPGAVT